MSLLSLTIVSRRPKTSHVLLDYGACVEPVDTDSERKYDNWIFVLEEIFRCDMMINMKSVIDRILETDKDSQLSVIEREIEEEYRGGVSDSGVD